MIAHGDELGRTQRGNNNTYAQDNELSWVHWDEADHELIDFVAGLTKLRREHPTFRRRRFFNGRPVRTRGAGEPLPDIEWLRTDATPMSVEDWDTDFVKAAGVFLNGQGIQGRGTRGERITDDNVLLYFNASEEDVEFTLPAEEYGPQWFIAVDTAADLSDEHLPASSPITVVSRSMMLLVAA
jgi:glycogen operon protein